MTAGLKERDLREPADTPPIGRGHGGRDPPVWETSAPSAVSSLDRDGPVSASASPVTEFCHHLY